MQQFCEDAAAYLESDKQNVIIVHCKAGKGRTGTMITALLQYMGVTKTADDALRIYANKRTVDKKGITVTSQKRYVHYYQRYLKDPEVKEAQYSTRLLQKIRLQNCLQAFQSFRGVLYLAVWCRSTKNTASPQFILQLKAYQKQKSQNVSELIVTNKFIYRASKSLKDPICYFDEEKHLCVVFEEQVLSKQSSLDQQDQQIGENQSFNLNQFFSTPFNSPQVSPQVQPQQSKPNLLSQKPICSIKYENSLTQTKPSQENSQIDNASNQVSNSLQSNPSKMYNMHYTNPYIPQQIQDNLFLNEKQCAQRPLVNTSVSSLSKKHLEQHKQNLVNCSADNIANINEPRKSQPLAQSNLSRNNSLSAKDKMVQNEASKSISTSGFLIKGTRMSTKSNKKSKLNSKGSQSNKENDSDVDRSINRKYSCGSKKEKKSQIDAISHNTNAPHPSMYNSTQPQYTTPAQQSLHSSTYNSNTQANQDNKAQQVSTLNLRNLNYLQQPPENYQDQNNQEKNFNNFQSESSRTNKPTLNLNQLNKQTSRSHINSYRHLYLNSNNVSYRSMYKDDQNCTLTGDVRIGLFRHESCQSNHALFNYWLNLGLITEESLIANVKDLDRPAKPLTLNFKLELEFSQIISQLPNYGSVNDQMFNNNLNKLFSDNSSVQSPTNVSQISRSNSNISGIYSTMQSTMTFNTMNSISTCPRETFQIYTDSKPKMQSIRSSQIFGYGMPSFSSRLNTVAGGESFKIPKPQCNVDYESVDHHKSLLDPTYLESMANIIRNNNAGSNINLSSLWTSE